MKELQEHSLPDFFYWGAELSTKNRSFRANFKKVRKALRTMRQGEEAKQYVLAQELCRRSVVAWAREIKIVSCEIEVVENLLKKPMPEIRAERDLLLQAWAFVHRALASCDNPTWGMSVGVMRLNTQAVNAGFTAYHEFAASPRLSDRIRHSPVPIRKRAKVRAEPS